MLITRRPLVRVQEPAPIKKEIVMKLYVVSLPGIRTFPEVRDVAKKVDPYGIITVVNEGRSFEFQNKIGADEVARVFEGVVEVVEFDVTSLYK